jgi:hypothetical protein
MKKYILTDQTTLAGVVKKLLNKPLTSRSENFHYLITSYTIEKDLNNSISIVVKQADGSEMNNPNLLVSITKENKVEIRIKQLNPYRNDLFIIVEIIITPLERSAQRAQIKNINLLNLYYSPQSDLTSLLSLYGKTSVVTQAIQNFQLDLETILNKYSYFITKVNVGFYYAANTPLLNHLADTKAPYFMRDAYRKVFYTERTFFDPATKMKDVHINSYTQKHLIENVKSVLIIPFFGSGNTLLGYVELQSSLPDLGNQAMSENIESPEGIAAIVNFIESRCEFFTFQLELSYLKEWKLFSTQEDVIDISQDGRGIGCYISDKNNKGFLQPGAKVSFSVLINDQYYQFYAGIKNVKPSSDLKGLNMGLRIYVSEPPDGLELLAAFAGQFINTNKI